MGITGFMLWNPIATTRILPGSLVPAAKLAHSLEALLAVLAILIWHVYAVHLRHFNKSIFTGDLTEEEMEDEHPKTLARIKAGEVQPVPDAETLRRRRMIFWPVYAVVAAVMLVGIYFFVAFEETAIATVPPPEDVVVFAPLTPTPLPTVPPTPTPSPAPPTATPAPGAVEETPPAEEALTWDAGIGELMQQKCVSCHSSDNPLGGLDVSSYLAVMSGGSSGPAVVPGESDTSLLVSRQVGGDHPGQFTEEELGQVVEWIEAGALEGLAGEEAAELPETPAPEEAVVWQDNIASLIEQECVTCHSSSNALGGLDLSTYEATMAGGDTGPAVVPGESRTSLLVSRQASGDHPGQFSDEQLELIVQWIEAGAPEN
jgi:mono/diheme cytochrome c family protein